jgi:hypothetical protein
MIFLKIFIPSFLSNAGSRIPFGILVLPTFAEPILPLSFNFFKLYPFGKRAKNTCCFCENQPNILLVECHSNSFFRKFAKALYFPGQSAYNLLHE